MSFWTKVRSMALWLQISAMVPLIATAADANQSAVLEIAVDISEQVMTVKRDNSVLFSWQISAGKKEYPTPLGIYHPTRMHEVYFSVKYDGIPMPHSIFFFQGYAIHGTLDVRDLGRPASRGCIRLHPENAKVLFDLVAEQSMSRTRIIVED